MVPDENDVNEQDNGEVKDHVDVDDNASEAAAVETVDTPEVLVTANEEQAAAQEVRADPEAKGGLGNMTPPTPEPRTPASSQEEQV